MTLDEAIEHCVTVAGNCNRYQCSNDHLQLAGWLLELKRYRSKPYCGECAKYDAHDHRCKHWNHGVGIDDYCSFAVRKENI